MLRISVCEGLLQSAVPNNRSSGANTQMR